MLGKQFKNPHGFLGKVCCKAMNIINKPMYDKVIKQIDANKNSKILDVGFGNGFFISKLSKNFQAEIYGVEPSVQMCQAAEKRNKKAIANGKILLTKADCCSLPFENESFDFVTSINTIYFWQNTKEGLCEIFRILKKDGIFYNAVYTKQWLQSHSCTKKDFKLFELNDYITLGKEAGFFKVEAIQIKKDKSFVIKFQKTSS